MRTFAVAGLQLSLAATDNTDLLCTEIRQTHARLPWLDMVVAPELAACGTGLGKAMAFPNDLERRFCELAAELGIYLIPGSFYEKVEDEIFNMAPVIDPSGQVILRYRKMFPFLPYEADVTAGGEFGVFDVPGVGRLGLSICYDMWFPETTRTLAAMGVEAIIHPSLTNTIDRDAELAIARSAAVTNQLYMLDFNVAGELGLGRSGVFGPGGEVVHLAGQGKEVIAVELDLDYVQRVRERGWHGLGQPLKSFRDSHVEFPVYQSGGRALPGLSELGALERPGRRGPTPGESGQR